MTLPHAGTLIKSVEREKVLLAYPEKLAWPLLAEPPALNMQRPRLQSIKCGHTSMVSRSTQDFRQLIIFKVRAHPHAGT